MVESGGNDQAVGQAGEIGPHQITRAYWLDGGGSRPARPGPEATAWRVRGPFPRALAVDAQSRRA